MECGAERRRRAEKTEALFLFVALGLGSES
jgi:hypothetical protein